MKSSGRLSSAELEPPRRDLETCTKGVVYSGRALLNPSMGPNAKKIVFFEAYTI